MYTNADGLVNKRYELKVLLQSLTEKPDIIAITEFIPKKVTYQLQQSEFNLEGYNIFFVMDLRIVIEEGCCFILQLIYKSLLLTTHRHSKNVFSCC